MLQFAPAAAEDELFLYELYVETRREELSVLDWDDAQRHMFLRMQFDAQRRSYRANYPDFQQRIIYLGEERIRIGQISSAVTPAAVVLVDVTLLPPYRNQGIGARLLTELQDNARQQGKGVRLHVLQHNPAQRLYARFGFRVTGEQFPYLSMEWNES